eukprot:15288289-Heterocapsa_arctica.AAC.1
MGYAWIYNKTKNPMLADVPEFMNILETGLQRMGLTEDSDGTEEEFTDQYEITDKSKITEEDMNNIRQPDEITTAKDGQYPPEARDHREHHERK